MYFLHSIRSKHFPSLVLIYVHISMSMTPESFYNYVANRVLLHLHNTFVLSIM